MHGKKLVFKVIVPAVCCLLCALVTWICVMGISNPAREATIGNIRVEIGEGFSAVAEGSATVSGPHSAVASLLTGGLTAHVPFGEEIAADVYSFESGEIAFDLPEGVTAVCDGLVVTVTPAP